MAKGKRPVPFRTRKLSPSAPMVLRGRLRGRVGRRRTSFTTRGHFRWPLVVVCGRLQCGHPEPAEEEAVASMSSPERARPSRSVEPAVPEGVDWLALDREARAGLRSLPKEIAERVGAHL